MGNDSADEPEPSTEETDGKRLLEQKPYQKMAAAAVAAARSDEEKEPENDPGARGA